MPGTVHGDWEEGQRFYGFDDLLIGSDFGYNGPQFSCVPVPDQYNINLVHQRWIGAKVDE